MNGDPAIFERQRVARLEAVHAFEERLCTGQVASAEEFGKRLFIRAQINQAALEDRLDLGTKQEPVPGLRPVERLDAEPIACEEQALSRRIPDGKCEHAAKMIDGASPHCS